MIRALVLSDTHLRDGQLDRLPDVVWRTATEVDVVLHAGDVVERELLTALGEAAPVHAVLGNNDVTLVDELPESTELELGGVRVAMVHDSGARGGREARMSRRFPGAKVVLFGHSHEPQCAWTEHDQLLFNPGSATQRRRQPQHTFGVLELDGGTIVRADVVAID